MQRRDGVLRKKPNSHVTHGLAPSQPMADARRRRITVARTLVGLVAIVLVAVAGYEPVNFEAVEVVADRPLALDVLLRKKRD